MAVIYQGQAINLDQLDEGKLTLHIIGTVLSCDYVIVDLDDDERMRLGGNGKRSTTVLQEMFIAACDRHNLQDWCKNISFAHQHNDGRLIITNFNK